jgi:predicted amidophosphoribosyltransferase
MITGNYIVTTIGCFLLGLLLNRSSKKRTQGTVPSKSPLPQTIQQTQPTPSSSMSPTTGIRCGSCGAITGRNSKYCAKCGSKIEAAAKPSNQTDQQRYTPQVIATSLSKVRGQNEAQYVNLVQNLLMVDEQGRCWSIGVNSSKWYVQEGEGWLPSHPQGTMRLTHRNIPILETRQMAKPSPPTSKTAGKTCRFCGTEMDASAAFCLNCGKQASTQLRPTATPPRTRTCGRCGATVNARRRFCTSCGAQLTA